MWCGRLGQVLALAWLAVGTSVSAEASAAASATTEEAAQNTTGEPARWITHRVVPGQSPASIAARYGISVADLQRWNPRVSGGRLRAGWILQLKTAGTVSRPRPTLKTVHIVRAGETWESIATLHGISEETLRHRAGVEQGPPPIDDRIVVWRDEDARPWNPYKGRSRSVATIPSVRGDARSVGRTNGGSLNNSVALPPSSLYDCWRPGNCYGSSHAVGHLVRAIARFRATIGWDGTLLVKSISKQGGGHFPPHKSHQSGRDVDIQLPRLDGGDARGREDQVDWHATWALVNALLETGEVEVIFLAGRLHPLLRRAAKDMGASGSQRSKIGTIVRPWRGHHTHMHVRFRCGPQEAECIGGRSDADEEESEQ